MPKPSPATISRHISPDTWTIAAQVKFFRERRKLSCAALGKLCGMHANAIVRLERTPDHRWNMRSLARLAHALGVQLNFSLGG